MKPPLFCRFRSWAAPVWLALFLTHTRAAENELADALQALQKALRDEVAIPQTPPAPALEASDEQSFVAGRRYDTTALWMAQLSGFLEQDETEQAERVLTEISASTKAGSVQTACTKLREELDREHETKEQSALKHYRDAEDRAEAAVRSATVPADLDAALRELSLTSNAPSYRASGVIQKEASHVQNLRRYVILWQNYLASREHGDTQTAIQELRTISQDESAEILPRSEILARIEELKTSQQASVVDRTGEILARLKGPDQIAEVVRELQTFQTHSGSDYSALPGRASVAYIIGELQSDAEIYNAYQAGLPTSIESLMNRSGSTQQPLPAEVQNLKAQLLRLLCVRQLNPEEKFKLGGSEPITEYLNRLLADARERGDARMIMRIREMQRQIGPRTNSYSTPTTAEATGALQAMLAAQNQEEAGQFIPAVVSYENALRYGSDVVPAKAIGARLDAIKASHPDEYEKGLQISLRVTNGTGPKPASIY